MENLTHFIFVLPLLQITLFRGHVRVINVRLQGIFRVAKRSFLSDIRIFNCEMPKSSILGIIATLGKFTTPPRSAYDYLLTLLITFGLGYKFIEQSSLRSMQSHLVSIWGISMASQIDWMWVEVVPDSGPKSAATPDRRR